MRKIDLKYDVGDSVMILRDDFTIAEGKITQINIYINAPQEEMDLENPNHGVFKGWVGGTDDPITIYYTVEKSKDDDYIRTEDELYTDTNDIEKKIKECLLKSLTDIKEKRQML